MQSSRRNGVDKQAMVSDWSTTGNFFGSIMAGLLLGLLADKLLGTSPWFVVSGVVVGFGVGFWRMLEFSRRIEEQAEMARRQRDGL